MRYSALLAIALLLLPACKANLLEGNAASESEQVMQSEEEYADDEESDEMEQEDDEEWDDEEGDDEEWSEESEDDEEWQEDTEDDEEASGGNHLKRWNRLRCGLNDQSQKGSFSAFSMTSSRVWSGGFHFSLPSIL